MTFIGFMQYVSFFGQVAGNLMFPVCLFCVIKALKKYSKS